MALKKLLIANRGEVSIRVSRAAADLGIATVAIHSQDDAASLHVQVADEALPLSGRGVPAYLDGAGIVRLARAAGCDSIHPGYGFLAENAAFARACEEGGLRFVGPAVETLELFGDKLRAPCGRAPRRWRTTFRCSPEPTHRPASPRRPPSSRDCPPAPR